MSISAHAEHAPAAWAHPWVSGEISPDPALFIVGSYRCGTTSLFNYFAGHPAVRPCMIKEPGFFFSERWKLAPPVYPAGQEVAAYLSMFRGGRTARLNMEATSNYLHDPGCARRIASAFPAARIIVILRDPVRRLLSWYDFLRLQRWLPPSISVDEWLQRQMDDARPNPSRPYPYQALEHGLYSRDLAEYLEVFEPDRIRVVWHEQLCRDAGGLMAELARFAGVDPSYFETVPLAVNNAAQRIRRPRLFSAYRRAHRLMFRCLKPWPWVLFHARNWFFGRLEPRLLPLFLGPADKTALPYSWQQQLRRYYARDFEPLERLLGEAPPWQNDWQKESVR